MPGPSIHKLITSCLMADVNIDYVLDANVVMSMLISGRSQYRRVFRAYNLYSTNFLYTELEKYRTIILQKSRSDREIFQDFGVSLFRHLCVIPELLIEEIHWEEARFYCEGIDPKDVAYVALSISLDIPLLTRDKPLCTGLRKKGFRNALLFNDFLTLQQ